MQTLAIKILTEAGPAVGLGHLARCVAFYDAFESLGGECELVVAGDAPSHIIGLRQTCSNGWHQAEVARESSAGADIVVIDSYLAGPETYEAVAEVATVPLYVDDTGRLAYPRGVIVNGSPTAHSLVFAGSEHTLLLGPLYQVMRREFWANEPRMTRATVRRVLVMAGGTDAGGVLEMFSAIAAEAYPRASLDVVRGPRSAAEIRNAILAADIAVTTAGQTIYELAALGTPMVAACVADNQVAQARAFARAGALRFGGVWGEPGTEHEVATQLAELADKAERSAMAAAGQRLVDGGGAVRVARTCARIALEPQLRIARANSGDESDLLDLANDPLVRGMSFAGHQISPSEHHLWLERLLGNPAAILLTVRCRGSFVGQVRFDLEASSATISISLADSIRGLGLAKPILDRSIGFLREAHPKITALTARVKAENHASQRLFESAGFISTDDSQSGPGGVIHYRKSTATSHTKGHL